MRVGIYPTVAYDRMTDVKVEVVSYVMANLFNSNGANIFPERTTAIVRDTPKGTLRADFPDPSKPETLELVLSGFPEQLVKSFLERLRQMETRYPIRIGEIKESRVR